MATDEIVIDDYSNPRFSPQARAMLDAIAAMPALPLEPEALMAAASEQTGLDDFGDDWFREPLDIVCRAIPVEAGLNAVGRVTAGTSLVNMLANRLRLEDLLRRHPEIEQVPIARPIIIVGLPRTGTTHLHNLLSADPQLRSLPYWESLEPVPATIPPPDPDPRIERARHGDRLHRRRHAALQGDARDDPRARARGGSAADADAREHAAGDAVARADLPRLVEGDGPDARVPRTCAGRCRRCSGCAAASAGC